MPMVRRINVWLVGISMGITLWANICPGSSDIPPPENQTISPDGIHILDGSFVLDVGELHVNITNHGLIGSLFNADFPFSTAPSAQWPGSSGDEYLWGGGLWIAGRVDGQLVCTTGFFQRELRPGPDLTETMYEAKDGRVQRPHPSGLIAGRRLPQQGADDDHDFTYDEDWLNGRDDDGDGFVDEDFAQLGDQMFTCTMHDDLPLVRELYPDHLPIGVQVVQRTAAWADEDHENIVALDFEITNTSIHIRDDIYLGFFADFDIQRRQDFKQPDDLAGFFDGAVRGEDGSFYRVNMAYALDGAQENPLPGCIGLMTVSHTTDFQNYQAPHVLTVNSFQIFSSHGQVNQGGEPVTDQDRYYVMSRNQHDPDKQPGDEGDMKVLVATGPFNYFKPGETIKYQLALVIGDGIDGALATAVTAAQLARGQMVDFDNNPSTGRGKMETKICLNDLPDLNFYGHTSLFSYRYLFMDEFCTGSYPVFGYYIIGSDNFFIDENGDECIWVNADNCDECYRKFGVECTEANNLFWDHFIRTTSYYRNPEYFTGIFGRETRHAWIAPRPYPPISPKARVVPGNQQVEVIWDDSSEYDPDPVTGLLDFESYRVWQADPWSRPDGVGQEQSPPHENWAMVDEIDLVNIVPGGFAFSPNDLPLGRNTGLENSIYTPGCLSSPKFDGLAEVMDEFVTSDRMGQYQHFPMLRGPQGAVVPGLERFIPWESYPSVLDTFFAVTSRTIDPGTPGVDKRATTYYHYVSINLHNGFPLHFSVTATDHTTAWTDDGLLVPTGPGTDGEPANTPMQTMPRPESQTPEDRSANGNNIYVFPNPATKESLEEFLSQPASYDDPTGVRVMFNNLPEANNTIRIFTLSGDLVQTIEHDGYSQGAMVPWNLMSRNGQEVVSGIYLYSVHSDRSGFDNFRGRFVIIR